MTTPLRLDPETGEWLFNAKQHAQLLLPNVREILFGGAAGGGKSEGMLQMASQWVDLPDFAAILFRRTLRDLNLSGALMARAREWWVNTDASWSEQSKRWTFPSGATVQFAYLENPNDHLSYQSAEFQLIGFDELSQFLAAQYLYLFSRQRRKLGSQIPLMMRTATNPGGPGHEWVMDRWNLPEGPRNNPDRLYIPAFLTDNPFIDQDEYVKSLQELDPVVMAQLLSGDWTVTAEGGQFHPERIQIFSWDKIADIFPNFESMFTAIVRYWDLAATEPTAANYNPDWTVGMKVGITRMGRNDWDIPDYWILDTVRARLDPDGVEQLVKKTAMRDGRAIPQWFEQERGATGKHTVSLFDRHVLPTHEVHGLYVTGDKQERARRPAAMVNANRVYAVEGDWNRPLLAELGVFPTDGAHDDQVDALSGAVMALDRQKMLKGGVSAVQEY